MMFDQKKSKVNILATACRQEKDKVDVRCFYGSVKPNPLIVDNPRDVGGSPMVIFLALKRLWLWLGAIAMVHCGSVNTPVKVVDQQISDGGRGLAMGKADSQRISFNLLTYNVQSRPILDGQRARIHLPLIAAKVSRFDIVHIQECFAQCGLFLDQAPHGEKYYFSQRKNWFSLVNSGLATLAYRPMSRVIPYFFKAKAEIADRVASKGILLTQFLIHQRVIDVYTTHMQAGSSPAAQGARIRQMQELVEFVNHHSPPSHQVILSGDFNMGPRRDGKDWSDYKPNHYSSQIDMLQRTAVFDELTKQLNLTDVSDQLFGPHLDHIERVLYRSGTLGRLTPHQWQDLSAEFVDSQGQPLSDGMPLAVGFLLDSLE